MAPVPCSSNIKWHQKNALMHTQVPCAVLAWPGTICCWRIMHRMKNGRRSSAEELGPRREFCIGSLPIRSSDIVPIPA
jgi:hypothetical protein